jgi:hypothetical protein
VDRADHDRNIFYVYALYRDVEMSDPFYIGKGYGKRIRAHEKAYEIAKRHNIRKNNTINKLIAELGYVPKKIIAGGLSEFEAFSMEIGLISKYGRLDLGTGCLTNLSEGGLGVRHSPETREKIKIARARQVCTVETRAKMRLASTGRKHTLESRAKLSAAMKGRLDTRSAEGRARQLASVTGRKHTDETRKKMSVTRKGKKLSASHVEAIARGNRGKKRSEEARYNISKSKIGHRLTPETRAKISASLMGNQNRKGRIPHGNEIGDVE